MALSNNIFGVLGRWSPAAGDRTWKCDCIITLNLCLLRRYIADIRHRGLPTKQAIRYFYSNRQNRINSLVKFVSNSTTDLRSSLRS